MRCSRLKWLFLSLVLLGSPISAHASNKAQIFEALLSGLRFSGTTLSGGRVYFYSPGTTTNKTIYANRNKTTQASVTNDGTGHYYVTLDSNGQAEIYGDGAYDVVVKTSGGTTKATWEGVFLKASTEGEAVFIGDYDNDLDVAIDTIGSTPTYLIVDDTATLSTSKTLPSTLTLDVRSAGTIAVGSNTFTVNGNIIFDGGSCTGTGTINFPTSERISGPTYQYFATTLDVNFTEKTIDKPEWFGNVDGTNDEVQVDYAVDALTAGGTVALQAKTYVFGASMTVSNSGIVLRGEGRHQTIITGNSVEIIINNKASFIVQDLTTGPWITATLLSSVEAFNVKFTGTTGIGSYGCTSVVASNCDFLNSTWAGLYMGASGATATGTVKVDNCTFKMDSWAHGNPNPVSIYMVNANRLLLSNSYFENIYGDGGFGYGIYSDLHTDLDQITISNSEFKYTQNSGNFCAIFSEDVKDLSVTGCKFNADRAPNSSYGIIDIRDNGGIAYTKTATIVSNMFRFGGIRYYATNAGGTSGYLSINISGNNIESPQTPGIEYFDNVSSANHPILIADNIIRYGYAEGIKIFGNAQPSITGNFIFDCNTSNTASTAGIYSGANRPTISNNTISNQTATGNMKYGIAFSGQAANFFYNNIITDVDTAPILNGWTAVPSSGTFYAGDITIPNAPSRGRPDAWYYDGSTQLLGAPTGWLYTTDSWDPPSIADAASATKSVTVTGCQPGDTVLCGFQTSLAGMQLTGYVSSTNNAVCVLSNLTGFSHDLGNDNLYVRVIPR